MSERERILVFGDIHGGLRALKQLIQTVGRQPDDTLIFLGDYVDGWSESAQVVRYLMDLETQTNCVFIKGNHDLWCEEWLNGAEAVPTWLRHGGVETINSYKDLDETEKVSHARFFSSMKNYHIDNKNRLFIHAGFSSMHGPSHELYSSNFSWDRTLWEVALVSENSLLETTDPRYPKRLNLFEEIYIGHTPTTRYGESRPMRATNVINLDTGAAFKGRLSCMEINSGQLFQSDPVHGLYPDERGRNK